MKLSRYSPIFALAACLVALATPVLTSPCQVVLGPNADLKDITDETFDGDVLNSNLPVLLEFWANCSSPCKLSLIALMDLQPEYDNRLVMAKLDIEASRETAKKLDVRTIPSRFLYKNGKIVATGVGVKYVSQLRAFIDGNL